MHTLPYTEQQVATQNFERGYIACVEDILGLKEELEKIWKGE